MSRDTGRDKAFTRRAALIAGGQLGLAGLLVGRMYYLQVLESDTYQILADENRINLRLLPPPRGRITDRFGVELARNRQNYRILLVPEQIGQLDATLDRLDRIARLGDGQRQRIKRDVQRNRPFVPVTVAENLSWEQFAQLNVRISDLAGVQPDVGASRHYPFGAETAHVVGYVAAVSEEDLTGDPLLELPGFRIGKNGIERDNDRELRGRAGSSRVEVNAYGREIRELARQDGIAGDDITLTIDAELQRFTHRLMAGNSASAVVMDVHTGDILTLTSTPSYDPNAFNLGLSSKAWNALVRNPRKPLINKSIAGQYPPGSTFKMIVALAGLEAGLITPETRSFCNGAINLGRHRFHCWRWRYGGHGHTDLMKALAESCDIYFYELAKRLGVDRIADMARRFGLGAPLHVGLTGERGGLVPSKDWKLKTVGERWQTGESLITGIGQGYLLATPLQLALMTARLANGGLAVEPRLVRAVAGDPIPNEGGWPSLGLDPGQLRLVQDGMIEVVNGARGTAKLAALDGDVMMAGKTGTAQVRRISRQERASRVRKNEEREWRERDHSLFVAYAPHDAPRYAVAVVIEHGGSSKHAAALTKQIMAETLRRDPAAERPETPVRAGASPALRESRAGDPGRRRGQG